MKLTHLKFAFFTTLVALTTGSFVFTQPAKADLFCWPWEDGCQVDGQIGTSGNNVLGGARDGFNIRVVNRTGDTIQVSVRAYVDNPGDVDSCITQVGVSCNEGYWHTFGVWEFVPGESALILDGSDHIVGRSAVFAAYSNNGKTWEKEVDMGDTIGSFTFTFNP